MADYSGGDDAVGYEMICMVAGDDSGGDGNDDAPALKKHITTLVCRALRCVH